MSELAWLIPLLPFGAFLVIAFTGRFLPGRGAPVALLAIFASFGLAVASLLDVIGGKQVAVSVPWLTVGQTVLSVGYVVDPLAAMMLVVVSSVSFLVQLFSVGYMDGDQRYPLFFAELSLFTAAMLGLVLANSFVELYIFWELVGLCSYLLIGFWFEKAEAASAAKKAFIVTRVGDLGLLLGILMIFVTTGSFAFNEVAAKLATGQVGAGVLTAIAVLVFMGAVGKSAQFPLHIWLPDAMEGPTPVSALIHAATMVAAGVYLVARVYALFALAPVSLTVVAYIGGITAFMAASIALTQNDIKRVLAYSTVSQLGYMMLALGVGGYVAGTFHLMTHAFFKALLFLAAGSVIHAVHTQDIDEIGGGLFRSMKITGTTFLIGALALAGIPPLSGFFSKDEILIAVYQSNQPFLFLLGAVTAFMTAFYMFRVFFKTFFGTNPHAHEHAHESPAVMTVPLIILAVLAAVAGVVGTGVTGNAFHRFISHGVVTHPDHNYVVMGLSVIAALGGIGLAYAMYQRGSVNADLVSARVPALTRLLANKYYVDEMFTVVLVKPTLACARLFLAFDQRVVDGIVDGVAALVAWVGDALRYTVSGRVQNYALLIFTCIGLFILILEFWG